MLGEGPGRFSMSESIHQLRIDAESRCDFVILFLVSRLFVALRKHSFFPLGPVHKNPILRKIGINQRFSKKTLKILHQDVDDLGRVVRDVEF